MIYQQAESLFLWTMGAEPFEKLFNDFKVSAMQAVFKRREELERDHWTNFAEAIVATRDGETAEEQMDQMRHFAKWLIECRTKRLQLALMFRITKVGYVSDRHIKQYSKIRAIEDAAIEILK